jgi:hypothetical protein
MIWHPAVGDHNPSAAIDFFGQSAREPLVMPVIMKDLPASVASRHDMVDGAWKLDSWLPRHASVSNAV